MRKPASSLAKVDYSSAYLEQTHAFGELIRNVDQSTPVPTCPGWSLGQLFRHVGRGDRCVETPVWTFLGPRPAGWWVRRRLHEVAVHRADVAITVGGEFTLEPNVAADGISEFLERIAVQAGSGGTPLPLEDDDTLHLHATDPGLLEAGEWTVRRDERGVTWSHRHGKGAVALRGGATELLLAMVRRLSVADTGIELLGDAGVWQKWLDRTPL